MPKNLDPSLTNVTSTFRASHKPVREGVYQRYYPGGWEYCMYRHVDGWSWKESTPERAENLKGKFRTSGTQILHWRGLTETAYRAAEAKINRKAKK